jgi:hypothetical protein
LRRHQHRLPHPAVSIANAVTIAVAIGVAIAVAIGTAIDVASSLINTFHARGRRRR